MVEHTDNIDEQMEIYQRLVEVSEEIVLDLEEEGCFEDPVFCSDIDWYAGSMDNLAVLYLEKKEYAKAVPLLERALQLYRIQEEFDSPLYLWQRYYALKRLVQCYTELGNKTMANICRYEQVLLERKYKMLTHDDASEETQDAVK
jgi:tetratricopeptide (TPR) repeat protein